MKSHRYFYRICIISCMCCSLIALSGCRSEMMHSSNEKGDVSSESYEIDKTSIKTMLNTTPKHIKKNLGKNISIDAEVIVPKVEEAPAFIGKHILIDEEYFVDKFFKNRKPEIKETERQMINEVEKIKIYTIENEEMVVGSGSVVYSKGNILEKYTLPIYNREAHGVLDVYSNGNLEFMSREEAIGNVEEILSRNGVSIYGEAKVYALTAEKMKQEQEKAISENENVKQQIKEGYLKKQEFVKDDECYVLFFRSEVNNIPITQDLYLDEVSGRVVEGINTEVWINKDGIISLIISNVVEKLSELENPENLLSVDEAMSKLQQRYDSVITDNKMNFNEITLEYVGIPDGKKVTEIKFVPTWCFNRKERRPNEQSSMRVNAVTGEVF
ncbi:hypothetical protein SAMN02745196_03022 [Clostridium collagenovorans DSM 3089]|uniref:Germination protein, Ger(X)C family n=2 Tax=Clostridium TaxID=1485 RepID=A0A1M5YKC6_9CLOT|nr:hypothetical protein SAMN02745196_03022 [Clostridium collagenovorans DSM 3089]